MILSSWLVSSYEIKMKTKPGDRQGEMTLAYSLILSSSYEIKTKTKPGDRQGEMTLAYSLIMSSWLVSSYDKNENKTW